MSRIVTIPVLAGAYRGGRKSLAATLTHAADVDASGDSLCGRIVSDHLCDEYGSEDPNAPPTCPTCARRDPRSKS